MSRKNVLRSTSPSSTPRWPSSTPSSRTPTRMKMSGTTRTTRSRSCATSRRRSTGRRRTFRSRFIPRGTPRSTTTRSARSRPWRPRSKKRPVRESRTPANCSEASWPATRNGAPRRRPCGPPGPRPFPVKWIAPTTAASASSRICPVWPASRTSTSTSRRRRCACARNVGEGALHVWSSRAMSTPHQLRRSSRRSGGSSRLC
mmetsp:Transcript_13152/g.38225  ORF Transcript_13152/g.38225 Transcript_13152/m.38225 type:complete len:202 (-) Transcript_13152:29-634(-)